jgi:hypothetical protein
LQNNKMPNPRLQPTLTREFFTSEAPAPQPSPLKEQNRVVMLREGKITDAHRFATKTAQGTKTSSFAPPGSPASRGRARGQALAKAQRENAELRLWISC